MDYWSVVASVVFGVIVSLLNYIKKFLLGNADSVIHVHAILKQQHLPLYYLHAIITRSSTVHVASVHMQTGHPATVMVYDGSG